MPTMDYERQATRTLAHITDSPTIHPANKELVRAYYPFVSSLRIEREWCSLASRGPAGTETGVRIVPRALGAELVARPARVTLPDGGDRMTLTSDDAPDAATTAVVTIRIPAGGDDDLVTCVEARLARATGVTDVTVTELHGVEPKLSATIVTVGVTIGTCSPTADSELRDRLADVPGVESIDRWK